LKLFKNTVWRLFKYGLIIILTIYIGLYLYFQFGWSNHYTKQQVDSFIVEIQNTRKLSDSFYLVYDRFYSDRHERISVHYLRNFWTDYFMSKQNENNNWQLMTAWMLKFKGYRYKIAPMTLAFKINKHVTPEKCFDFVMTNLYADYSATFKLSDSIINLTETDKIIEFMVASQRPHYYKVHPTVYKRETDSLKLILFNK